MDGVDLSYLFGGIRKTKEMDYKGVAAKEVPRARPAKLGRLIWLQISSGQGWAM